jgi:hypothetical protein
VSSRRRGAESPVIRAARRRPAEAIEAFGAAEIQDLVLHMVVNEFGNSPSITIYFRRGQPATE